MNAGNNREGFTHYKNINNGTQEECRHINISFMIVHIVTHNFNHHGLMFVVQHLKDSSRVTKATFLDSNSVDHDD